MHQENPSSRESQVENMVERIEARVQLIKDMHQYVLSLDTLSEEENDNLIFYELRAKLQGMLNAFIANDEKMQAAEIGLARIADIKAEIAEENRAYDNLPDEERLDRYEEFTDSTIQKTREKRTIEENPDVQYLGQIKGYIEYLCKLKEDRDEYMAAFKQDGGTFKNDGFFATKAGDFIRKRYETARVATKSSSGKQLLPHNFGNAQYEKALVGAEFRGLGIILIFSDSKIKDRVLFKGIIGQRFTDSCLSARLQSSGQDTSEHEYRHMLYGFHPEHKYVYASKLIEEIDTIARKDSKFYKREEHIEDIGKNYLGNLMGEVFADFNEIFNGRDPSAFLEHCNSSIEGLFKYAHAQEDQSIKKVVLKIRLEILRARKNYLAGLDKLISLTRSIGKLGIDRTDDVMAGMLLFSGDTRKVLRYLQQTTPEDIWNTANQEYKEDPHSHTLGVY